MRILHLSYFLKWGGVERQMSYLLNDLTSLGHEVHLGYFAEGQQEGWAEFQQVRFHKVRKSSHYDPLVVWRLIRLIQMVKPGAVQTWHYLMDTFGGLAARISGTPWVIRDGAPGIISTSPRKDRIRSLLARSADMIISNSVVGDRLWAERSLRTVRRVIPNGLPLGRIEEIVPFSGNGFVPAGPVVLYVGQLHPRKKLHALLAALQRVREKLDVTAILCGAGPLREELEGLSRKHSMTSNIQFAGQLPKEQVWALMKRADVFVSLSVKEGCPNAVLEAMACSCPVVVSDIAAHREILDHSSSRFVNPDDSTEVADAIIDTVHNKEAARRRTARARERVLNRSVSAMTQKYLAIYKEITRH